MKFKWNKSNRQIMSDCGLNKKFMLFASNTAWQYMRKFTPMDTGTLSTNVDISADNTNGYIKYLSPYSRKIYYGYGFTFNKTKNVLATAKWDKAMISTNGDKYYKTIKNARGRFAKND